MARKVVLVVLLIFAIIFMVAAEDVEEVAEESPWPENVVPGQFLVPVTRTLTLFGRFTSEDSFCTAWQCYIVTDEETAKWHEASGLAPYYEPVLLYELFADPVPVRLPDEQWSLHATGWNNAFAYMAGVPDADPSDTTTPVIATIDTGMRGSHDALQKARYATESGQYGYVYNYNRSVQDYEDYVPIYDNDSAFGHGTHVAGIIGGPANGMADNKLGGSGMGKVRVLPFNASYTYPGKPDNVTISSVAAIKAIDKIIDLKTNYHVPIVAVNMSYGQGAYYQPEYDAMEKLYDAGIIAVVAAGNEGVNLSITSVYPANYNLDNIITVAAVGNVGTTENPETRFASRYSNYGGATGIAAPGSSIISSINIGDGYYGSSDGTSMATPFVAGALGAAYAVYKQQHGIAPEPEQLVNLLYNSAKKNNGSLTGRTIWGEIDLEAFIQAVYSCTPAICNFDTYSQRPYLSESTTTRSSSDNSELFGCGCSLTGGGAKFNFFELAFAVMVFGAYKLLMRRRYMN